MNLDQARHNMVEQQIRPWEVLDQRVLDLINALPRHGFVPAAYRNLAYADIQIPLGHDQRMMEPKVEARMLQALNILPTDTILEIGTGSGYVTALLARSGKHVHSVDIYPDFTTAAGRVLSAHGIANATLETGDASLSWTAHGPQDVIAVTGSLPVLPDSYIAMLKPGGRMFVILGKQPVMEAMLITRTGEASWTRENLFETDVAPLVNAVQPQRFIF